MFQSEHAKLLMFHALSPIHAGSGSSTGAVDLPIQRERHTARPIVQSSGLKGALREAVERSILAEKKLPQANWETKQKILADNPTLKALFG
ncbi:MAG: RAMP superfamily CRISPR-associated protein, partial [SAR324 cluster bacterium]|nr:RAMP superfamily CRISPR-associated protein [SAR324 cluster bacterium]